MAAASPAAGEGPGLEARRPPPPAPLPAPPLEGRRPGEVRLGEPPAPRAAPDGDRGPPVPAAPDRDGSRFLWFLLDRAGTAFEYLPASEMLAAPRFEPVPPRRRRPGDLAWWKGFVALYRGERAGGEVSTATGPRRLRDLEREWGPARFLRLLDPPPLRPAPRHLAAFGRGVRFANPDPSAWSEGEPQRAAAAVLLSMRRRPVREPGGGEATPVITLGVSESHPGVPAPSVGVPPGARLLGVEEGPGWRLWAFQGQRALALTRADDGLRLAAACTASESTWRVVERECRAFLGSLGVEPAR